MEHIAAFMLLIACNDDLTMCEEKPTSQVAYQTVESCREDIANQIRIQDIMSPTTIARCVTIDPLALESNAEITWDINKERALEVAVEYELPSAIEDVATLRIEQAFQTGRL